MAKNLELDGRTIWAACICDAVNGNPAKALVKLGIAGNHHTSWLTQAGKGAFGESVVDHNGKIYLGAGGSDFVAEYDKARGSAPGWARDTSGSTQVVEVMDGKLVIGGHFYAVADQGGDRCGAPRGRRPEGQSYPQSLRRVQDEARHSRLLLSGRPRPGLGPGILGQLQLGVGAARRGAQAAHRRRVQEGQRGGAELLRAALACFPVGGALPQKEAWVRRATRQG